MARVVLAPVLLVLLAACAAAPPPVIPGRAPDLDELLTALVAARACFSVLDYQSAISTADLGQVAFAPQNATVLTCLAAAHGDCDLVMACTGYSRPDGPVASCTNRCEGDTSVWCWDAADATGAPIAIELRRPCAPGTCDAGQCSEVAIGTCPDPTASATACVDSSTLGHCRAGELVSQTTCPSGTACGPVDGCPSCEATCGGTGATCPTDDAGVSVRGLCEGDVWVDCLGGREGARIDCASAGMHCTVGDTGPHCTPSLDGCAPGPATCDGAALTLCGPDGRLHVVDCVANGFTGCGDCAASGMTGCDGAICLPRHRWPWHAASYAL